MIHLASVTEPPAEKSNSIRVAAYALAIIYVVMVVAQLFEFEQFVPLIESFWLPGGMITANIIATAIVVCEVFALPFLLRVPMSVLMRILSAFCCLAVGIVWLGLALWINFSTNNIDNIGILGTTVPLPVGLWSVFYGVLLISLSAYVTIKTRLIPTPDN